ncbi:type IV pilus biogenesis/stability protein PilW [Rhodoferax sp.]|uniref:type IV pilus biogenesis/stability protein PilW n=1 Tax=Rhodoferax sp. TaxID=50421 RepID=UPI0025E78D65|nr:type IV pilus biogenesis/stability protein PilW [Rhodoferax sp.]MCM2296322.1 type IV pilus biogenesis/stability protein PilW [Rhodoferax sp.]
MKCVRVLGKPGCWPLWPLMALFGIAVLTGCASAPDSGQTGASRPDLVTDSDETSARKRARIRVELALGYLEQGKTTIALDEVKLALAADPGFADAYSLRGLIYMRLNELTLAQDSFLKALAVQPRDPNILHNLGWLRCQQARYPEALADFSVALANPNYGERAKTYMAQGLCQIRAGLRRDAEQSLLKSYEYDAANPVTGYNLANLLFQNADFARAQFYIRRLNNSQWSNAESLWLGIKVEQQMADRVAMMQLATQLEKRFPQSKEASAYRRGAFDE